MCMPVDGCRESLGMRLHSHLNLMSVYVTIYVTKEKNYKVCMLRTFKLEPQTSCIFLIDLY